MKQWQSSLLPTFELEKLSQKGFKGFQTISKNCFMLTLKVDRSSQEIKAVESSLSFCKLKTYYFQNHSRWFCQIFMEDI